MDRKVILVADDNEDNRLVFSTILKHHGYDVIEAEDGRTAIAAAQTHRPHLILLDLRMPDLTGWQTVLELKGDPVTGDISVLATSAERPDSAELQQAGFCGFVPKPITPLALVGAVKLCFEGLERGDAWQELPISDMSL